MECATSVSPADRAWKRWPRASLTRPPWPCSRTWLRGMVGWNGSPKPLTLDHGLPRAHGRSPGARAPTPPRPRLRPSRLLGPVAGGPPARPPVCRARRPRLDGSPALKSRLSWPLL